MSFLATETQISAQTFWLGVVPGVIPANLVSCSSVLFIFWNGNGTLLPAGMCNSSPRGPDSGRVLCPARLTVFTKEVDPQVEALPTWRMENLG